MTESILHAAFDGYTGQPHEQAGIQMLEDAMPASLLKPGADWYTTFSAAPQPKDPLAKDPRVEALAAVLELLRHAESVPDGYIAINHGVAGDTPGGEPALTAMTIAQVQARQEAGWHAVGAYQFIPTTLTMAAASAEVKRGEVFSPAVQDRLAVSLLLDGKRPRLADYLKGWSDDLNEAQTDLAFEWASMPLPSGKGAYDGDQAGNHARARVEEVRAALQEGRKLLSGKLPAVPVPRDRNEPQFYSQRDNGAQADRTCFSSACAMLAKRVKPGCLLGSNADLDYLKIVERFGDTTEAHAQIAALAELGIDARLAKNGDFDLIEEQCARWGGLALGYIHNGSVANPQGGGHWCFGWDTTDRHLVAHDPGGEADMLGGGFVSHWGGKSIHYTRSNFSRRWEVTPRGSSYIHTPGTGWAIVVDAVS